jgi:hypothetical protein
MNSLLSSISKSSKSSSKVIFPFFILIHKELFVTVEYNFVGIRFFKFSKEKYFPNALSSKAACILHF